MILIVATLAILGISVCAIRFVDVTHAKIKAQGTTNQSFGTTELKSGNMSIVEPASQENTVAVPFSEAQAGVINAMPCEEDIGCVRIITKCTIDGEVSCDPIVSQIFTVVPLIFKINSLQASSDPKSIPHISKL